VNGLCVIGPSIKEAGFFLAHMERQVVLPEKDVLQEAFKNAFESDLYLGYYLKDARMGPLLRKYILSIARFFGGAIINENKFHCVIERIQWKALNRMQLKDSKAETIKSLVLAVVFREKTVIYSYKE
jgi:hypothetical protein